MRVRGYSTEEERDARERREAEEEEEERSSHYSGGTVLLLLFPVEISQSLPLLTTSENNLSPRPNTTPSVAILLLPIVADLSARAYRGSFRITKSTPDHSFSLSLPRPCAESSAAGIVVGSHSPLFASLSSSSGTYMQSTSSASSRPAAIFLVVGGGGGRIIGKARRGFLLVVGGGFYRHFDPRRWRSRTIIGESNRAFTPG